MDTKKYRRSVDKMTTIINLGRSIDADISEAEGLYREAIIEVARGNDRASIVMMKDAELLVMNAIKLTLDNRLGRTRSSIKAADKEGMDTTEAEKHAVKAHRALKAGDLSEAARYDDLARTALDKVRKVHAEVAARLEWTIWLIKNLFVFETISEHTLAVYTESRQALEAGFYEEAIELDRSVLDEVLPRLCQYIDEMLDHAQKVVIVLRDKEKDLARLTLHYRSAADYLEMARRRYDRGTPDDIRVALEYLREFEKRYSDVKGPQ